MNLAYIFIMMPF